VLQDVREQVRKVGSPPNASVLSPEPAVETEPIAESLTDLVHEALSSLSYPLWGGY
jgi:hypothetical protein